MGDLFVVQLQPGCWLAPWPGDPGRTCVVASAKRYTTERGAQIALGMARRHRALFRAEVLPESAVDPHAVEVRQLRAEVAELRARLAKMEAPHGS